jgi:hypothetical protein
LLIYSGFHQLFLSLPIEYRNHEINIYDRATRLTRCIIYIIYVYHLCLRQFSFALASSGFPSKTTIGVILESISSCRYLLNVWENLDKRN